MFFFVSFHTFYDIVDTNDPIGWRQNNNHIVASNLRQIIFVYFIYMQKVMDNYVFKFNMFKRFQNFDKQNVDIFVFNKLHM
jgi:hypothetical protein